jgi:hypothetical protein
MLFDWLFKRLLFALYLDKEDPGGGGDNPDDGAEDDPDKDKSESEESEAGDDTDKDKDKSKSKAKDEKVYSKAEMETIVKDRLEREKKKAEADAEKARKDAEEQALEKNKEWQKLAESRGGEIETLKKEKADLEPFKESSDRYKKTLDDMLAVQKKKLPKHILPLIEKMDVVEAMDYITAHAKDLGVQLETYSETPDGKEKKVNDDDKKDAQRASSTVVTQSY